MPKSTVTFTIAAQYYELRSASTGQMVALVRDQDGMILNGTGTMVTVNSLSHATNFPAIPIAIPEFASQIRVRGTACAGWRKGKRLFQLDHLRCEQAFQCVHRQEHRGRWHRAISLLSSGSLYSIRFTLKYTLASSHNGSFLFDLKERAARTTQVLQDMPPVTLDIPPGSNLEGQGTLNVNLPLRDAEVQPQSEVYYRITMKDDAGRVWRGRAASCPRRPIALRFPMLFLAR